MTEINDQELMHKLMKTVKGLHKRVHGSGPMGGKCHHHEHGPNGQGCPMHGGMGPGMMMGRHHMPPFAKPGLGHGHSREHLLVLIGKHPDGIRQKELAEGFGINQSSTSKLVSKLEDDGYLKREVDPKDKRATLLFLTDLGKARAAEVEDAQKTMFEGLFKNLTAEEKQTFGDLLDKIRGDQN